MKNTILTLLLLFAIKAKSQTVKPVEDFFQYNTLDNIYFKDVNHIFDKFLGTWEYSSGPHYLKVVVTKFVFQEQGVNSAGVRMMKIRRYLDFVNCFYIYKYNGITVYDQMPSIDQLIDGTASRTSIFGDYIKSENKLSIYYNEPSTTGCFRRRDGRLLLTYLGVNNSGQIQLQWDRTDKVYGLPASFCEDGNFDDSEYKIPAHIVLTKQSF